MVMQVMFAYASVPVLLVPPAKAIPARITVITRRYTGSVIGITSAPRSRVAITAIAQTARY